jgi:hypothetical protein
MIAKGELTDERLAEILGDQYEWDSENKIVVSK